MKRNRLFHPCCVICLVLFALLLGGCKAQNDPQQTFTDAPTSPMAESTADAEASPQPTATPAAGYVRVIAGNDARWFALPENEEYSMSVRQQDPSGGEYVNVVHFAPNGVWMESSTCDNQDCVNQGEVTLDNKDTRVLSNWIICLPHQVSVELYTPDELQAMSQAQQ